MGLALVRPALCHIYQIFLLSFINSVQYFDLSINKSVRCQLQESIPTLARARVDHQLTKVTTIRQLSLDPTRKPDPSIIDTHRNLTITLGDPIVKFHGPFRCTLIISWMRKGKKRKKAANVLTGRVHLKPRKLRWTTRHLYRYYTYYDINHPQSRDIIFHNPRTPSQFLTPSPATRDVPREKSYRLIRTPKQGCYISQGFS